MTKHTPGPWLLSDEEDGLYVRAKAAWPDDWYVCRVSDNNGATLANASLLTAAPDLFSAAKTAMDALTTISQSFKAVDKRWIACVQASAELGLAIIKAEGK